MWWLWIAGPLAVVAIYLLTAQTEQDRTALEIDLWRNALAARKRKAQKAAEPPAPAPRADKKPAPGKADKKAAPAKPDKKAAPAKQEAKQKDDKAAKEKAALAALAPPELRTIAAPLMRMLDRAGGGTVVGHYELVPNLAYLSVLTAMATMSSDQQTVVAKLAAAGPTFSVRPLPIVDGQRVANTGIKFKKDPEFMAEFLVQGADPKAIGKWLIGPLRDALRDLPEAWLLVEGKLMALTVYGRAEAGRMEHLVATADELFAEYGAKGGPSLFGVDDEEDEDDDAAASASEQAAGEDEDEDAGDERDDDEDAEDEDEEEDSEAEDEAARAQRS